MDISGEGRTEVPMGSLYYVLDRENFVVYIGGPWDGFARQNGGAEGALRNSVLNRPIMSFVAGAEVRSYLNALFFAARHWNATISLPMRCDSPQERRCFRTTLTPGPRGILQVLHQPQESIAIGPEQPYAVSLAGRARCAICSADLPLSSGAGCVVVTGSARNCSFVSTETVCMECKNFASAVLEGVRRDCVG